MRRVIGIAALVLLSGCGLQQDLSAAGGTVQLAPSPAPALSGTTVTGAKFDLAAQHGHPVVVDFFGSWCGPCRAEQASLTSIASKYQPRGVAFIAIAMRDDPTSVAGYEQDYHVPYPAVLDDNGSIAANYDIVAPPTLMVINRSGDLVAKYLATTAGLTSELDTLLASK